jgi:hypothetical protein
MSECGLQALMNSLNGSARQQHITGVNLIEELAF